MNSLEGLSREQKIKIAQVGAEKARRKLHDFCCWTLPGYKEADHLTLLDDKLEAVERGEIKKLMIFMPPRHGKSEKTSIRFPAWYLGRNPDNRVITASYAATLSHNFSRQTRDLVEEKKYKLIFDISTSDDSRAVNDWNLANHRGGLLSQGVGGAITGYGADLLIIDDPVKDRAQAESEVYRERVWDWYRNVARTRLEPDAAQILIMTRWHRQDLAGKLLDNQDGTDDWVVLDLPAIFEKALLKDKKKKDPLGRKEGQALWPGKYDEAELAKIKKDVGSRTWYALYQQKPRDPKDQIIQRDWIQWYETLPPSRRGAGIDTATSKKTSADNSSMVDVCRGKDGFLYCDDVFLDKVSVRALALHVVAQQTAKKYLRIHIEENNAGNAIKQRIEEEARLAKILMPLEGIVTDTDKVVRVMEFQPSIENGTLKFNIRNPRVVKLVDHLVEFTGKGDTIDDDVDGLGLGIKAVMCYEEPIDEYQEAEEEGEFDF